MHSLPWRSLLAALFVGACFTGVTPPDASAADEPDLKGAWKLVSAFNPLNDSELLLIDITPDGNHLSASIAATQRGLESSKVNKIEQKDGKLTIDLQIAGLKTTFTGTPAKDGKYYGLLPIQTRQVPTRLEKGGGGLKAEERQPPEVKPFLEAREQKSAKDRVKKFGELLKSDPGGAKMAIVYSEMLKSASEAQLPASQVKSTIDEWLAGAARYGEPYVKQMRAMALQALAGQKPYADLALDLATRVEKEIGDAAPLEARALVAANLADAAKLAGKTELAESAAARSRKLEAEIDEEYHKKIPPFKAEPAGPRKDKASDRVVLLELFTGAQCPPCVAADVAFDVLNDTYKPSELVTLQYHLHIPGPDPLTNPDAVVRSEYYPDFGGTPATYFNGRAEGSGGGYLQHSRQKYEQYRQLIDKELEGKKGATIDLQVKRTGDDLQITVEAQAVEKVEKSKLRLRLALVEKQVRYKGGNNMLFHHHVVRGMPGGVAGKELPDGKGKTEVTVKLGDLRKGLEEYLSDFTKQSGGFSGRLPEIALADLSVVAFVQDDETKRVLHAVMSPVGGTSK